MSNETSPVLEVEHLGISFGGLKAVGDFNLEIAPGELVGLIGPNGAGKTTVFNLLTGVYKPTEGEIRLCGRLINGMVEQLFAFSKMEMAEYPLHPQRVELRAEIGRIVKETAPQSLSVSLAGLGGEAVEADRALLERIVLNILENSRKYRVGPTAHVDISSRTAGEAVELRFDDDGPGVDAEKLGKLFDAFYRADPARKNPSGGSGLGLSIVRGAAERMGGKVWAENGRLGGLTVVLTLPAAKGEADGQDSDY